MQPTLTVHIGCAKGGSSAIQGFLARNVGPLRARGIVVPTTDLDPASSKRGNQINFFQRTIVGGRARPIDDLEERLVALLGTQDGVEASEIVLSAENLCNPVGFEQVLAGLRERFRVRLLMYVRRQDDYLESAWQQWYVKEGRSLLDWMIQHVGTVANWHEMLEPWVETFGAGALTVRCYDRNALVGGDVVTDFCDYAGIDPEGLRLPRKVVNPSYDGRLSVVVEGRPGLFDGPHDHRFYRMVDELTAGAVRKSPTSPRLFSTAERQTIMGRYAKSNEALRRRFLPQLPAPLFETPDEVPQLDRAEVADYERELLQLQIRTLYDRVVALEHA